MTPPSIEGMFSAGAPGPPKRAYHAMQTLSATLGTTGFVRDAGRALNLDMEPSAEAFALLFASRDGRVNVHVLWTRNEGQIATARISSTEGQMSAHDAFGDPVLHDASCERSYERS